MQLPTLRLFSILAPIPAPSSASHGHTRTLPLVACVFAMLASTATAQRQDPERPPNQKPARIGDREGLPREEMWRAPTAEDWAKPVQIQWERTWEDALAVSEETGKPILVCVNMDGEIASEHYAGIRYRQKEVGELFENYVCLIASTYRHTPHDHDEQGRRIPCPRFGGVTCEEHIRIEPQLYEKYFEGTRVAPRHIMIEADAPDAEVYDVYYAFDTASVFERIQTGIDERDAKPKPFVRGDRTLVERVASRAAEDRVAVEKAFLEGDAATRERLLKAALQNADRDPLGLLRLAIQGLDERQAALARQALAKSDAPQATELIAQALSVPLQEEEREVLVRALEKIADRGSAGGNAARARTLAVANRAKGSQAVDVSSWVAGATYEPAGASAAERAEAAARRARAASGPDADAARAAARLDEALATLELALDPESGAVLGRSARAADDFRALMLEDAHRAFDDAESLGAGHAGGWKFDAVRCVLAREGVLSGIDEFAAAERAVANMGEAARDHGGVVTFTTLRTFAEGRRAQIVTALRKRQQWSPEWLADMDAAYRVIAQHPLGTDTDVVTHYDFLHWMRAWRRAGDLLELGLKRFDESWILHDRMRQRILRRQGAQGLLDDYTEQLADENAPRTLRWFAGYAAIVAAESFRRRDERAAAVKAYDRALELYAEHTAALPNTKANCDYYAALCLAGKARLTWEDEDLDGAVAGILASFARGPQAAAAADGLNLSPVDTAKQLRAAAETAERQDLVDKIDAAFAELAPEQLERRAFDRGGAPSPDAADAARRSRQGR